jgi:hypothetical protein
LKLSAATIQGKILYAKDVDFAGLRSPGNRIVTGIAPTGTNPVQISANFATQRLPEIVLIVEQ